MIWHDFFAFGRAYLAPELKAVVLAREMKWTWDEYLRQPQWFVSNLLMMLQAEAEEAKRRAKA